MFVNEMVNLNRRKWHKYVTVAAALMLTVTLVAYFLATSLNQIHLPAGCDGSVGGYGRFNEGTAL